MDLLDQARRYLDKMPPATSGAGGHNQTLRAACIQTRALQLEPACRPRRKIRGNQRPDRLAPHHSRAQEKNGLRSGNKNLQRLDRSPVTSTNPKADFAPKPRVPTKEKPWVSRLSREREELGVLEQPELEKLWHEAQNG